MTISQNSSYVLSHPFLKQAVQSFMTGDDKDLKFLLDLIQIDTYQEVATLCTKAWKKNKTLNFPQVEEAIREVSPPDRLNIKLPIPLPKPECIVVPMKIKKLKVKICNCRQLELEFKQA